MIATIHVNSHGFYVSKVSTRFGIFLSGFASVSELTLVPVNSSAEFDTESNGDIFRVGCP
jgi:hypothetical protein